MMEKTIARKLGGPSILKMQQIFIYNDHEGIHRLRLLTSGTSHGLWHDDGQDERKCAKVSLVEACHNIFIFVNDESKQRFVI